jgi:F-type H+-transporting ATPase subunit alpha
VSAYIPTNVISITDGQIFLETDLFFRYSPAVNVGLSVSRVGSSAQTKAVKGRRQDQGRARAVPRNGDVRAVRFRSRRRPTPLNGGARLTELLKQPQFSPMKMEEQVVVIWAGTNGYLDPLPVNKVREFEEGLLSLLRTKHADILNTIRDTRDLGDETAAKLKAVVEAYANTFA